MPGHAAGAFYSAPPDSLAGFVEWGKGMIGRGMDRGKGWGDRKGRRGGKGMRRRGVGEWTGKQGKVPAYDPLDNSPMLAGLMKRYFVYMTHVDKIS